MKYTFLLFFTLFFNYSFSQNATISCDKMNILYTRVDNPITIVVEGKKSTDYKVFINNGIILRDVSYKNSHYIVRPKERGKATIFLVLNKKDTAYKFDFRVKRIDLPYATIASKTGGKISKNELKVQEAIFVYLDGFDFDYKVNVSSYHVKIIKKCKDSYSNNNNGFLFTNELKSEIEKLESGDWVIFSDIKVKNLDGLIDTLTKPLFFEII